MGQNGQFGVTSGPFQNYSMAGVISNGTKTINGTLYPAGELVLTGQVTNPSGVGTTPLTVTVTQANLQSFIIYGANPAYNVTVGSDTNKVVQKIIADYSGTKLRLHREYGAQSERAWTDDWKLALLDVVRQQTGRRRPSAAAAERRVCRCAAGQPGLLQRLCLLFEQQQRPGDGRLWLPLHRPAASPLASLTQHGAHDDHPARRRRVASVRLGHYGSRPDWRRSGRARRPDTVLDAHGHRRRNGDLSAENAYSGGTTIIDGTTVEVTNSNPGISSSIGTGLLTLDNGILEAGANNLAFITP